MNRRTIVMLERSAEFLERSKLGREDDVDFVEFVDGLHEQLVDKMNELMLSA